jgi:hypothetical protein
LVTHFHQTAPSRVIKRHPAAARGQRQTRLPSPFFFCFGQNRRILDASAQPGADHLFGGTGMDDDKLNMAVRKFLKTVGVSSQREIETAVAAAVKAGTIKTDAKLKVKMTLQIDAVHLTHVIEDTIDLG